MSESPNHGPVLVVENEEAIREMLCYRFAGEGVEAVCVEGCAEALDALKGREFAAIVLDLGMSPVDGKTCGGAIHTLYPSIPIVAYTGYPEAADGLEESGFVARFIKPRDDHRMVEAVCRLAGKGAA